MIGCVAGSIKRYLKIGRTLSKRDIKTVLISQPLHEVIIPPTPWPSVVTIATETLKHYPA